MEEVQAERAQIEAERAESAKMMEELMALKAQLEKQQQSSEAEAPADTKEQAGEVGNNENLSDLTRFPHKFLCPA